ncbi:hypothetical protein DSECCO2_120290 [anaerobic digester metagenome]
MSIIKELVTVDNLIDIAKRKGYRIFENNGETHNLNIWFIRANNTTPNSFDDLEVVFWRDINGDWITKIFTCTTDPGTHYLLNLINVKGTAIVKPGQYVNCWERGYHKGDAKHPALIQISPITVIRDFNKDKKLDYTTPNTKLLTKEVERNGYGGYTFYYYDDKHNLKYVEDIGNFGINNHRASSIVSSILVDKYSAGCFVQNDIKRYNNEFIPIIDKAVDNWGNKFTFTVIEAKDLVF